MTQENIILYPRSYNKRGDESLHSVQGVTAMGEEVNVKLRIPSNAKIIGVKPSIAEFARDDYGAKNVCIATPDNGPENPGGMLLFTGCEPDGENRKGMPSYIARWAHRLVADSEAPAPLQGIGRIDVSESTSKNRGLMMDIKALRDAKPAGWEDRVKSIETQLSNAVDFQYQLRIYRPGETTSFKIDDKDDWEAHFISLIDGRKVPGGLTGVYVRVRLEGGKYLPEVSSEMVPVWSSKSRFQTGAEVLQWLYRKNPELPGLGDDAHIVLVPIDCHTAGGVFRKHYGAPDRYHRLRQQYYPGDKPELCHIVASQSLHDGEPMLLRVHPLTGPLASPMKLDEKGELTALMVGEELPAVAISDVAVEVGLNGFSPLAFPRWFKPLRVVLDESVIDRLPDIDGLGAQDDISEDALAIGLQEPDEMVIIDDIYEIDRSSEPPQPMHTLADEAQVESDSLQAPEAGSVLPEAGVLETVASDTGILDLKITQRLEVLEESIGSQNVSDLIPESSGGEAAATATIVECFEPLDFSEESAESPEAEEPLDTTLPSNDSEELGEPIVQGNTHSPSTQSVAEPNWEPQPDPELEPEPVPEPDHDLEPKPEPDIIEPSVDMADQPPPSTISQKPKGLARFMAKKGLL